MANPNWHQTNFRRNLVDMHIEAWNSEFMSRFDPVSYVECMKTANVSCCMVYANSHAGYAYWPAPDGNLHPNLRGRDVFGEIVDLCHKNNIAVICYYTLIFDNWAYSRDPSWRVVAADGKSDRAGRMDSRAGRYGHLCPNSEGYREFTKKQVTDLVTKYEFESVFFDMTFWPAVCYCGNCQSRYAKEIGGEMPKIIDWNSPVWNAFQDKREKWLNEFAWYCTNLVKAIRPNVTVNHQYSLITQNWIWGGTEDHTDPCDYVGGDFYAGPTEQGLVCKLFNSLRGRFEFHTTRCLNLGDHTTSKTEEHLRLQSRIALAHNGAFLFIDAIDPTGTMNTAFYRKMGGILKEFQEYEGYLGGEIIADAAILFDMWSKFNPADSGKSVMDPSARTQPHLDAVVSAARILKERHIPYTVIGRRNLKNAIGRYRLIILPDVLRLSDAAAADIRAFVEAGGAVYASGRSGLTNLGDVFGIESVDGPAAETVQQFTYMSPAPAGQYLFADSSPQYPLAIHGPQRIVKARKSAGAYPEALAVQALPWTDSTTDGNFASIHSDPPGPAGNTPALLRNRFGKGLAFWAAAPIEAHNQGVHDGVFAACVEELLEHQSRIVFAAPPAAEAVCFAQADGILINLLNTQTVLPPVTIRNAVLTVDIGEQSCETVLLLPGREPIPFTESGGLVKFEAPPLELYHMLKLVYRRDAPPKTGTGRAGTGAAETAPVEGPGWKAAAQSRIEQHRMEDIELVVAHNGTALSGADIKVEMLRHEFLFGTNILGWGDGAYNQRFLDVFNYATLMHYWASHQSERGRWDYRYYEEVCAWCARHGVRAKTGALMSGNGEPAWIDGLSRQEILQAALDHIRSDVRSLAGKIDTFDVINELVYDWRFHGGPNLESLPAKVGKTALAQMSLAAARDANPHAKLLINDYDTGPQYAAIAAALVDDAGRPLFDAVGLQSHMHSGIWNNRRIWEICERFAAFGKPVHFTEMTVLSNRNLWHTDWNNNPPRRSPPSTPEGERFQMEELTRIYTLLFSHPAVEAVTYWDLSDKGAWYGVPAGLLRADMSPKPAYEALRNLIRKEWATNCQVSAGADGRAGLRAFRGDYRFTVRLPNGTEKAFTETVKKGGGAIPLNW
jgi:GH35 family endo-1,4-beta-xylanase